MSRSRENDLYQEIDDVINGRKLFCDIKHKNIFPLLQLKFHELNVYEIHFIEIQHFNNEYSEHTTFFKTVDDRVNMSQQNKQNLYDFVSSKDFTELLETVFQKQEITKVKEYLVGQEPMKRERLVAPRGRNMPI